MRVAPFGATHVIAGMAALAWSAISLSAQAPASQASPQSAAGGGPSARAAATVPAPDDPNYVPKRLPDGQPDIQGIYLPSVTGNIGFPIERFSQEEKDAYKRQMEKVRGADVPAHGAEWTEGALRAKGSRIKPGTPLVVDPPDGKIPWLPWAHAKRNYIRDNPYERSEFLDSRIRCLPGGTPREMLGGVTNAYQILQPPGFVMMLVEANHIYRIIPIAKTPPLGRDLQLWMGDSRGHWEGKTLVVEVTNHTDKTWVTGEQGGEGPSTGSFHSPAMRVVERYTIVGPDNIDYEVTIEDPNVFARPWTMKYDVFKRAPAGYDMLEYACHEGNRTIELLESSFAKPDAGR
jgi:hypothetical protein